MKQLLIASVLGLLVSGCAVPPAYTPQDAPASVAAPQVKVSDYWEYAVRDGYTDIPRGLYRYEVVRSDASGVTVQVTHEGRAVDTLLYAPGWNGREMPLPNTQRLRYEPSFAAYAYPLEPGKTWRNVVRATDVATGRVYNTHVYGKVVGWERITVPAGQFDALRIQREVFAGNSDSRRTQEEIRETDWYVPSVRRTVRSQTTSQHFDNSLGGGEGGEYPLRIRGDFLIAELTAFSR